MRYLVMTVAVLGVTAVVGWIIWRLLKSTASKRDYELGFGMLQGQLNATAQQTTQQVEAFRKTLQDSLEALTRQMNDSLASNHQTVGQRLDHTSKIIGDVRQQLGQLDETTRQIVDVAKDISRLEHILQPPKLRGSLGELFLSELLAQILPPTHYRLQYSFKGGEIVDAVVLLHRGMVPIDAKFPLENFKRTLSVTDAEKAAARKAFMKDVKGHVDAIASKYIRMDENTFDFALMYIPAENVYYETILKDDEFGNEGSLFSYALKKRVIPVSPNSFYAYLQTIILGLKGMRVEEHSREIVENLSRLRKEFTAFAETFRLIGQHLDNSVKKFGDAQKRFDRVESKLEQIDDLARGIEEAVPPAGALLAGDPSGERPRE